MHKKAVACSLQSRCKGNNDQVSQEEIPNKRDVNTAYVTKCFLLKSIIKRGLPSPTTYFIPNSIYLDHYIPDFQAFCLSKGGVGGVYVIQNLLLLLPVQHCRDPSSVKEFFGKTSAPRPTISPTMITATYFLAFQ